MSKVVYAQVSFVRDFGPTLENLKSATGHVDASIVVEDDSAPFTEGQRMELEGYAVVVTGHWGDNFPAFRNRSLEEAKKMGADWVIISDADEHFGKELWRDLKAKIIPGLEAQGFNQAGIRCFDDFEVVDWWDDLDKLKELPGGSAHETTWYKNLLFKLYPDVNYEGSGGTIGIGGAKQNIFKCGKCGKIEIDYTGVKEKACPDDGEPMALVESKALKVHEIWGSTSHPWVTANLPDPYHYIHRKSTLRIWHNAARNLFIGGGGDTVGTLNPMWVELREIASKLGIDEWHTFEKYVTEKPKGTVTVIPEPLVDWIKRALVYSATDYGTETRETAKWVCWYHRYLLDDPDIKHGIENPPKADERAEVENFVRKTYFQILGRHPDRKGLDNYVNQIVGKKMMKEQLPMILLQSPEFKQRTEATVAMARQEAEKVRLQLPVSVDVQVTSDVLVDALQQSELYRNKFKPRMDVGTFVEKEVSRDFWLTFYERVNKGDLDFDGFLELLKAFHAEKMVTGR